MLVVVLGCILAKRDFTPSSNNYLGISLIFLGAKKESWTTYSFSANG